MKKIITMILTVASVATLSGCGFYNGVAKTWNAIPGGSGLDMPVLDNGESARMNNRNLSCSNGVLTSKWEVKHVGRGLDWDTWSNIENTRQIFADGVLEGKEDGGAYYYMAPGLSIMFEVSFNKLKPYILDTERIGADGTGIQSSYDLIKKEIGEVCSNGSKTVDFRNAGIPVGNFRWYTATSKVTTNYQSDGSTDYSDNPKYKAIIQKHMSGVPVDGLEAIRYFLKNKDKVAALEADFGAFLVEKEIIKPSGNPVVNNGNPLVKTNGKIDWNKTIYGGK